MPGRTGYPHVGQRLAAARLQRGLSQGQVGQRAGIAPSYLSRIETGKVQPGFRTVQLIAQAMRIPLEQIAGPGEFDLSHRGPCPVSSGGACLLDLIHSESDPHRPDEEAFTPRQVKLISRFAIWLRNVRPDRQRAMEILIEELTNGATENGEKRR